jgi:hypothetical protein
MGCFVHCHRNAKRASETASVFVHKTDRFPLSGAGDVNTYALFAELFSQLTRAGGRAGIIVRAGIATDSSTGVFFRDLVADRKLFSLQDFQTASVILTTSVTHDSNFVF